MNEFDRLRVVKDANLDALMALPNVSGVGIGRRIRQGKTTEELVVGVGVTEKVPSDRLGAGESIPQRLETTHQGKSISVATDVVEVGEFRLGSTLEETRTTYRDRKRPIEPGYSVGGQNAGAGTIGCFLVIKGGGHLLSNLHVMQGNAFSPVYQPVLQPGPADRGGSNDIIGDTALYIPLVAAGSNTIDAATCTLRDTSIVIPNSYTFGALKGYYNQVVIGWHLRKVGRTTGVTDGHVMWVDYSSMISYPLPNGTTRSIKFDHQIVINHLPWGVADASGDSGSVWVTDDNYAAALTFAGNNPKGGYCVATPLAWVMKAFNAQLWVKKSARDAAPEGVDGVDPADAPFGAATLAEIMAEIPAALDLKQG